MTKFWKLEGSSLYRHDGSLACHLLSPDVVGCIKPLTETLSLHPQKIRNYRATARRLQKCLLASQASALHNAAAYMREMKETLELRKQLHEFKYGRPELKKVLGEWRHASQLVVVRLANIYYAKDVCPFCFSLKRQHKHG